MTSVVFRRKLRNWRWCRTFYKYQFPFLTFPPPPPPPQTMCQSGSGASKLGTFTNICYSTNWINTPSPYSRKITSTWIWLKLLFAGSRFIWGVRNRSRLERINFRNNALNLKTKYGAFKYCRGLALGSLNKKMISSRWHVIVIGFLFLKISEPLYLSKLMYFLSTVRVVLALAIHLKWLVSVTWEETFTPGWERRGD